MLVFNLILGSFIQSLRRFKRVEQTACNAQLKLGIITLNLLLFSGQIIVQIVYLLAWEDRNINIIWFKMLAGTNAFCMKVLMIMLVKMFGTDFTIENQVCMDG
jgi:hypothetical protein